jgi:uncharacterized membrane protein YeiH
MPIIYYLDLFGVMVFAISGALSAMEQKYDIMGVLFIAFVTAVGGGIIRDLMLGATPVACITDLNYPLFIFIGVLLSIAFKPRFIKLRRTLTFFDAIGISVFTVIGLQKSMMFDIVMPMQIFMGMITSVGGGLMRDVLCNNTPLIFHKEVYASACVAGALVFIVLDFFLPVPVSTLIAASLRFAIRILSVRKGWSLRQFDMF